MARSEGFEPSTAWFVARYSIQLSYERADLISINEYQVSDLILRNSGASWRIRTSDRLVRSQVLYPAELRTHGVQQEKILIKQNNGALGRIRTFDRLVRSQVLYPAELRARRM